jgi:hypothetical protein
MYNKRWIRKQGRRAAKRIAKRAARKAAGLTAKGLAVLAGTLGVPLILLLAALFFGVVLFASVYAAMPGDQHLTGIKPDQADAAIRTFAEERVEEANVRETWVVSGEGAWYPGKGEYVLGSLADRYGQDAKLVNQWGDAYAPALYAALQKAEEDKMRDRGWVEGRIKEASEALRPWFYYKESTVTRCCPTDDGGTACTVEPVYLLVEAYTIRGHFHYSYEWVTESSPGGCTMHYERLAGTEMVSDGRLYLEKHLSQVLGLPPDSTDIKLGRNGL